MCRLVGAGVRACSLGRRLCWNFRSRVRLQLLRMPFDCSGLCRVGTHRDAARGGLRKRGRAHSQGHQKDQRNLLHVRLTGCWMSLLNAPGQRVDDRLLESTLRATVPRLTPRIVIAG